MERKTPLYEAHVACGGKIVPFAGYLLPVQYGAGIKAEHMAVRTQAGLFDVSHMAELMLTGPDALSNIQNLMTNDCGGMADGQVKYSPMCNERGGVVDDLMVYRMGPEEYLLVVNAANHEKDAQWIQARLEGEVQIQDLSDGVAQLALQGPKAEEILAKLCDAQALPHKYYTFANGVAVCGLPCLISRTGYTGEDGFELYTAAANAPRLWEALLAAGKEEGLIPCGLGCRDTLRLEAAMPLYGHEMDEETSPLDIGLSIFVKLDKPDFIGKQALLDRGPSTVKRVGLWVTGRGIAREGAAVYDGERQIGRVTSGTHCPYVDHPVAMAILDKDHAALETGVEIDVRGRRIPAKVVRLPFYKRKK